MNKRQSLAGSMMFAMLERLDANKGKGDNWLADEPLRLVTRLEQEVAELREVIMRGRGHGQSAEEEFRGLVRHEAADVANFAAMVADRCGALMPRDWEFAE